MAASGWFLSAMDFPKARYRVLILTILVLASLSVAGAQEGPWNDAVSASVLAGIARDPALATSAVSADCYAGTLLLTGIVPSKALRQRIEAIAHGTPGVVDLHDEITLDADRGATDAANDAVIQAMLQTTLSQYRSASPPMAEARGRVYEGIVYLIGAVADSDTNDALQASVMALPGVRAVVAHLVAPAPRSAPPAIALPVAASARHPPAPIAPTQTEYFAQIAEAAPPAAERRSGFHVFRMKAGPLLSEAAAKYLCSGLQQRHFSCVILTKDVPLPQSSSVGRDGESPALHLRDFFWLQLQSGRSQAALRDYWRRQYLRHIDLLRRFTPFLVAAKSADPFYRLKIGPFADHSTALALCTKLRARQVDCLTVHAVE